MKIRRPSSIWKRGQSRYGLRSKSSTFSRRTKSHFEIVYRTTSRGLQQSGSVFLRTVVHSTRSNHDGALIEAVTLPWFDIIEILQRDPKAAFEITDRKWEEIIAGAYKAAGFDSVVLTPRSGDYGRDVIAEKHGIGVVRVIDQVKAYKPHVLVKANDVRALMGVLHTDGAAKGFVTTTSDFAPRLINDPLIAPLIPSRLGLINGSQLLERLIEIAKSSDTPRNNPP